MSHDHGVEIMTNNTAVTLQVITETSQNVNGSMNWESIDVLIGCCKGKCLYAFEYTVTRLRVRGIMFGVCSLKDFKNTHVCIQIYIMYNASKMKY